MSFTAPVLVWIHGGRFTFGSKTLYGSPAGLIARSRRNKEDGIIVVSINYRLGMFGWLAGDDVTPNLGLYDQRLALEWVKQYIALFGGSADKVTAMGESAGASSIVHHITAYGGEERAPFQAAIPQSPAFQFNIDLAAGYEKTLDEASKQTGKTVDKVDDLRKLSANTLSAINQATVTSSPIGTFGFGPGPDGSFVPDIPQVLLYQGKFDSSVNVSILTSPFRQRPPLTSPLANDKPHIQRIRRLHTTIDIQRRRRTFVRALQPPRRIRRHHQHAAHGPGSIPGYTG